MKPTEIWEEFDLNKYGLFEKYEEIVDFIKKRKEIQKIKKNQEIYLEEGDFIIYKLYELDKII